MLVLLNHYVFWYSIIIVNAYSVKNYEFSYHSIFPHPYIKMTKEIEKKRNFFDDNYFADDDQQNCSSYYEQIDAQVHSPLDTKLITYQVF